MEVKHFSQKKTNLTNASISHLNLYARNPTDLDVKFCHDVESDIVVGSHEYVILS